MRRIVRVLVAVLLSFVALGVLSLVASESGEVVVLSTTDSQNAVHETRLWIVEHDGALWLRAGVPTSSWFQRLRAEPEVTLERAGVRRRYRALPSEDAAVRDRIHARLAEKYGWADRLIGMMRDGSASVPVRLESLE